jgi:hypothetical protein
MAFFIKILAIRVLESQLPVFCKQFFEIFTENVLLNKQKTYLHVRF